MEGFGMVTDRRSACNRCIDFRWRLSSWLERFSYLTSFSRESRRFVHKVFSSENGLPLHNVEGLPTLHFLARAAFTPEDEQGLEELISFLTHSGYNLNQIVKYRASTDRIYKVNGRQCPALFAAVGENNLSLAKFLIRAGVEIAFRDYIGGSCLDLAASEGNIAMFRLLVEAGPIVTTEEISTGTHVEPILCENRSAAQLLETEIGRATSGHWTWRDLIAMEADLQDFTALRVAIIWREPEVSMLLLQEGMVSAAASLDDLLLCIWKGYSEIAAVLVGDGSILGGNFAADFNGSNEWDLLCLGKGAFTGGKSRVDGTKALISTYIQAGWNVNSVSRGNLNNPPDLFAEVLKSWAASSFLSIADDSLPFELLEFTLLHRACLCRAYLQTIKFLVEETGAHVNVMTGGNVELTPLHISILVGDFRTAEYLVEKGADMSVVGSIGNVTYTGFVAIPDNLARFNAVELTLRQGSTNGWSFLRKALESGKIPWRWNDGNALRLAIDGGNAELVLGVLEHLDLEELNREDFSWVDLKASDSPGPGEDAVARVPSLLHILHKYLEWYSREDDSLLVRLIEVTVRDLGFNCNLGTSVRGRASELDEKLKQPIIFTFLDDDMEIHRSSDPFPRVKTLLQVDHVNLNVSNCEKQNPLQYVIWEYCLDEDEKWMVVKLFIKHGINLTGVEIDNPSKTYRFLPLEILELLWTSGATLGGLFLNPDDSYLKFIFRKEAEREEYKKGVKELKERIEKQKLAKVKSLQHLCRAKIVGMARNVGEFKGLMQKLPKPLRKKLNFW